MQHHHIKLCIGITIDYNIQKSYKIYCNIIFLCYFMLFMSEFYAITYHIDLNFAQIMYLKNKYACSTFFSILKQIKDRYTYQMFENNNNR